MFLVRLFIPVLFIYLVIVTSSVDCFGDEDDHEVQYKCTNRFEFRHQLKKRAGGCDKIRRANPICGRDLTVGYSNHPPYVFQNDHENYEVQGILPGKQSNPRRTSVARNNRLAS